MVKKFYTFINEEVSKNDPIPELNRVKDHFGIILLGAPGAGKSTFISNFIKPRNPKFNIFSTDDVSLKFTKDVKKYHQGSSELNISKLMTYMKTGQNFIYDTTGSQDKNIFDITSNAKESGYKIIFIQVLIDLPTSKKQNIERGKSGGHQVEDDYLEFAYSRQMQNMRDYSKLLNPDAFYAVLNRNGKYKFFKYESGKLLVRKVDRYVPL